jgi:hypothetical protein
VLAGPDVGEPRRRGLEGEAADQGGSGALAGVGKVEAEVHLASPDQIVAPSYQARRPHMASVTAGIRIL